MKFNWLDLILMLIAFRGIYTGYKRGFVGELVFSVGSVASFICAFKYAAVLGERLVEKISLDPETAYLFCFLSIMFGGILLALIVASLVRKLFHLVIEVFVEKFMGAVLGVVRALLFGGVFMIYILVEFPVLQTHVEESSLGGHLEKATQLCNVWVQELAGIEIVGEPSSEEDDTLVSEDVEPEVEEVIVDETEQTVNEENKIPWM